MVEREALDDFKNGDWAGIHYKTPDMENELKFAAVIGMISNRNPNELDDYVEVKNPFPKHPARLGRVYLTRIRHVFEEQ